MRDRHTKDGFARLHGIPERAVRERTYFRIVRPNFRLGKNADDVLFLRMFFDGVVEIFYPSPFRRQRHATEHFREIAQDRDGYAVRIGNHVHLFRKTNDGRAKDVAHQPSVVAV